MDQLHDDAVDKLFTEVDHLDRLLDTDDDLPEDRLDLALSVAKNVRRASTLVVQALARHRDQQLQPRRHKRT